MATAPRRIEPPVFDPPLVELDGGGQRHSQAWTEHNQQVADLLNSLVSRRGVTDGSDAAAGTVGEVLEASGSGVTLSSGAVTTVAMLTLTPGDWDVSGGVTFNISGAASNHYGVGIDGALSNEIIATIPTGTGTWRLVPASVRRNVAADTAVTLSALAVFSSGAVTADGTLSARRAR